MKLPFEPKILAYSTSWVNNPIMTVLVPIPTVKLAEVRTHRLFHQLDTAYVELASNDQNMSFSANSSRAIPLQKQLEGCVRLPFVPIWTKNQKGMQGKVIQDKELVEGLDDSWKSFLFNTESICVEDMIEYMKFNDIHKQDASLLLNPYSWTTCVITGDKAAWENWFELRCPNYFNHGKRHYSVKEFNEAFGTSHSDLTEYNVSMTYPAIQVIAEKLYDLWTFETPIHLEEGQWHAAFVDGYFLKTCQDSEITTALRVSMSKCAMISYDNQDKEESIESHINRAESLIKSKHWSTAEHQYQVPTRSELRSEDFEEGYKNFIKDVPTYHRGKYVSNVKGWKQLRQILEKQ